MLKMSLLIIALSCFVAVSQASELEVALDKSNVLKSTIQDSMDSAEAAGLTVLAESFASLHALITSIIADLEKGVGTRVDFTVTSVLNEIRSIEALASQLNKTLNSIARCSSGETARLLHSAEQSAQNLVDRIPLSREGKPVLTYASHWKSSLPDLFRATSEPVKIVLNGINLQQEDICYSKVSVRRHNSNKSVDVTRAANKPSEVHLLFENGLNPGIYIAEFEYRVKEAFTSCRKSSSANATHTFEVIPTKRISISNLRLAAQCRTYKYETVTGEDSANCRGSLTSSGSKKKKTEFCRFHDSDMTFVGPGPTPAEAKPNRPDLIPIPGVWITDRRKGSVEAVRLGNEIKVTGKTREKVAWRVSMKGRKVDGAEVRSAHQLQSPIKLYNGESHSTALSGGTACSEYGDFISWKASGTGRKDGQGFALAFIEIPRNSIGRMTMSGVTIDIDTISKSATLSYQEQSCF